MGPNVNLNAGEAQSASADPHVQAQRASVCHFCALLLLPPALFLFFFFFTPPKMRSNLRRRCGRRDPGELETGDDASRTASLPGRSLLASNTAASHAAGRSHYSLSKHLPHPQPRPHPPGGGPKKQKTKTKPAIYAIYLLVGTIFLS